MPRLVRLRSFAVLAVAAAVGLAALAYGARASFLDWWWNLDIQRALDVAGVQPGMVVGEAGAGSGSFTLPLARRVGPDGIVYANDIRRSSLDRLAERARREHLSNIRVVQGTVDDPLFPRRDLALIVIVHALHDFDRPVEWLVKARGYLRNGGLVAVIDRDPRQGASRHFLTREQILDHARRAGYEAASVVDSISKHVIVVIRPAHGTPAGS